MLIHSIAPVKFSLLKQHARETLNRGTLRHIITSDSRHRNKMWKMKIFPRDAARKSRNYRNSLGRRELFFFFPLTICEFPFYTFGPLKRPRFISRRIPNNHKRNCHLYALSISRFILLISLNNSGASTSERRAKRFAAQWAARAILLLIITPF